MMFHRPGRLRPVVFCAALVSFSSFLQGAPQAQQQPPPQQQPKKPTPFETLPQTPAEPPKPPPQAPIQTVAPKPDVQSTAPSGAPPENIIEAFEFRGARRVRQDTLVALIFSKKGDRYDEEGLHRDFMALWNTGRFDDIRIEREAGKVGWIVRFIVVERPVVRSIKYEGNK
jgi:outer membrane protein insertion porin family